MTVNQKIYDAIQAILTTPKTKASMLLLDPKALQQLEDAVKTLEEQGDIHKPNINQEAFKDHLLKELKMLSCKLIKNKEPSASANIRRAYKALNESIPFSISVLLYEPANDLHN
jgi:hypothetical protein